MIVKKWAGTLPQGTDASVCNGSHPEEPFHGGVQAERHVTHCCYESNDEILVTVDLHHLARL